MKIIKYKKRTGKVMNFWTSNNSKDLTKKAKIEDPLLQGCKNTYEICNLKNQRYQYVFYSDIPEKVKIRRLIEKNC